jgi:DNA-binding LacI/PurR family transcriptional regulator
MLGRHDIVAPEKRDMVLRAVEELEYIPVRPTLQNRHVESRVIAVPVDEPRKIGWAINSGTYTGMCESAMGHGYDVLMLLRPDPDWAANRSEAQLLDRRSDGIVFASPVIGESARTFEVLARHKTPTVVCYRRDVPEGIAWVDPDNRDAMYQAVRHLRERGHTRIAHLTKANNEEYDKVARRRYFQEAIREYRLPERPDQIFATDYYAATAELPRRIIQSGATAVVCMNDLLATDLAKAMQLANLQVPDDLSIIGMDDLGADTFDLTTIAFSFSEIGEKAVDALVELIQGRPAGDCSREIPVKLVERQSVKDLRAVV